MIKVKRRVTQEKVLTIQMTSYIDEEAEGCLLEMHCKGVLDRKYKTKSLIVNEAIKHYYHCTKVSK